MSKLSQTDTITEMDAKISSYSKLLETVSDGEKPHLQAKLLSAKLMREKFVAMTAFAKAQSILAEMEVLVAGNNLKTACEQLDIFKKELDQKAEKKSHQSKKSQKESEPQTRTRESTPKDQEKHSKKKVSQSENKKSKLETEKRKRRSSDSNHSKSKKSKKSLDNKSESRTSNTVSPIKKTNDDLRPKTNHYQTNNNKSSGPSHSKKSNSKASKTSLENKTDSLTFNTLSPIKSNSNGEQRPTTDKLNDFKLNKEIYNIQINYDDEDTIILEDLTNRDYANSQVSKAVPDIQERSSKVQIFFENDLFNCVKTEAPSGDDLS